MNENTFNRLLQRFDHVREWDAVVAPSANESTDPLLATFQTLFKGESKPTTNVTSSHHQERLTDGDIESKTENLTNTPQEFWTRLEVFLNHYYGASQANAILREFEKSHFGGMKKLNLEDMEDIARETLVRLEL